MPFFSLNKLLGRKKKKKKKKEKDEEKDKDQPSSSSSSSEQQNSDGHTATTSPTVQQTNTTNHIGHLTRTTSTIVSLLHPSKVKDVNGEVQEAMLLRGITDPAEYQWRLSLHAGDSVDVLDDDCRWRVSQIVKASETHFTIKFCDTEQVFHLAVHRGGNRIAKPFTKSGTPVAPNQIHTETITHLSPNNNNSASQSQSQLSIHPGLSNPNVSSSSPLTPMTPHHVDYTITSDCIVHRPVPPCVDSLPLSGQMIVVPMSKDNSCLFHAIAFVCDGKKTRKGLHVMQQRLRVHELVKADPSTYNEVVLGAPINEYLAKLLNLSTWGGAIELGLFSSLYECEIFAFDFTQPTVYRFGDTHGYEKRVLLVYSGNHYNVLCYQLHDDQLTLQEYFSAHDETALRLAQHEVEQLHLTQSKKPQHAENIVWKGKGLYELSQKAKQLYQKYVSPKHKQQTQTQAQTQTLTTQPATSSPPLPPRPPPISTASSSPPLPHPPPSSTRMHSVSMVTPKKATGSGSHAHGPPLPPTKKSSFTFNDNHLLINTNNNRQDDAAALLTHQQQSSASALSELGASASASASASGPIMPNRIVSS